MELKGNELLPLKYMGGDIDGRGKKFQLEEKLKELEAENKELRQGKEL